MADEQEYFSTSVRIRVDGKSYVGALDIDAMGELQKIWKITALDAFQAKLGKIQLSEMKDIVFVSLLRDQPNIERKASDKIANGMGLHGIVKYVTDVVKAGQAPAEAVQRGPTKRAKKARANR